MTYQTEKNNGKKIKIHADLCDVLHAGMPNPIKPLEHFE